MARLTYAAAQKQAPRFLQTPEPRTYGSKVIAKLEDIDLKEILNPVDRKWIARANAEFAKVT